MIENSLQSCVRNKSIYGASKKRSQYTCDTDVVIISRPILYLQRARTGGGGYNITRCKLVEAMTSIVAYHSMHNNNTNEDLMEMCLSFT